MQFCFNHLLFGLQPSPLILGGTIANIQSELEMAALLNKSLYVDDLLSGAENHEKILEIYHKSKKIMASRGFNLRKWNLNSQTLLKSIELARVRKNKGGWLTMLLQKMRSHTLNIQSHKEILKQRKTVVKVLGMNWETAEDNVFFNFTDLCEYGMSLPVAKRSVLKLSAMAFDPMGFLTPCTVEMKILFQELCLDKVN